MAIDEEAVSGTEEPSIGTVLDSQTAGELLREERLRRGLSEKEVADRLHITMHYVRAIEADCYEKLPARIFATGYIKSYALLLDLDPDRLMELYANFNVHQQEIVREQARQQAKRKKDHNMPWVILSVLGFIAGFAGLWVYNYYFASSESVGFNADASPVIAIQAQSVPGSDSQPDLADPDIENVGENVVQSTVQETTIGTASAGGRQLASTDAASRSPSVDPQTLDSSLNVTVPAIASAPDIVDTQEEEIAEQSRVLSIDANGSDMLRLVFSGESWVEVNDGESRQIYRDIRGAGDILEIAGVAPFNLLLGDAPFISLTLNGEEIDVTDDIRIDNSARLTVGL